MIAADTITDEQIRKLRMTFVNVADWRAASICTMALWAPLSPSDRMFLMEPYHSQALKAEQMRKDARARCAEILNARAKGGAR